MDDPAQVAAYSEAGRIDGIMSAAYLFHSARVSQVIAGAQTVIDLGCGPATQLAQIAAFNPATSFIGIDLSPTMLESAAQHVAANGLTNVRFHPGDITRLEPFADHSVDGVISTMALHHLPTEDHLARCFSEIARVLKPGGALYLVDFGRLKSLYSILAFAYLNARFQPHLFTLDYERSLRAAFSRENFAHYARLLPSHVRLYATFVMPMLVVIKSADRGISSQLSARLDRMRRALPGRYRRDLNDMRTFFKLGGMGGDPF